MKKGNNSKIIEARVMNFAHDTPPHDALTVCEVSNQLIWWFKRYHPDKYLRTESRKDRRKDGWTECKPIVPLPVPGGGLIKFQINPVSTF